MKSFFYRSESRGSSNVSSAVISRAPPTTEQLSHFFVHFRKSGQRVGIFHHDDKIISERQILFDRPVTLPKKPSCAISFHRSLYSSISRKADAIHVGGNRRQIVSESPRSFEKMNDNVLSGHTLPALVHARELIIVTQWLGAFHGHTSNSGTPKNKDPVKAVLKQTNVFFP